MKAFDWMTIWQGLAVLAVALTTFLLWNRQLKRSVSRHTAKLKQSNEKLTLSLQRYRVFFENASAGIWRASVDGQWKYMNPKLLEITGFTHEQATNFGWESALHPEDRERVTRKWKDFVEGKSPYHMIYRFKRPGGETRSVIGHAVSQHDSNGRIIEHIGSVTDITEQLNLEVEKKLHLARERLSLAQVSSGIGIFDWDLIEGNKVYNEVYYQLFGRKGRTDFQSNDDWLQMVHADDRARMQNNLKKSLNDNAPYDTEYRVVWPDGSLRWLSTKVRVICDDNGKPVRRIGAMTDITEQIQAMEAQQENEERLKDEQKIRLAESERSRVALLGILEDQKHAEEALREHRERLEELVDERTQELLVRTNELERFNLAMVGRENRVIDLKVQINGLSKELGREIPFPRWKEEDLNA